MKKLVLVGLFLNAGLLTGRFWQELPANAQVSSQNGDVNGDANIDLSDAVYLLNFLFSGGPSLAVIAQEGGNLTPEQAEIFNHLSLVELDDGEDGTVKTLRISGVNVQVVNGLDSTEADNGLGNLIVGYQELRAEPGVNERGGSHNIVVGRGNNYRSHGGMIIGSENQALGAYSAVHGGLLNTAGGDFSTVLGGMNNIASGMASAVAGGTCNTAEGTYAAVSGGEENLASEEASSVSGGSSNSATGRASSVTGGTGNRASGDAAVVSAGQLNQATGLISSVNGGGQNIANEFQATVSGGNGLTASTPNGHLP